MIVTDLKDNIVVLQIYRYLSKIYDFYFSLTLD